MNSKTSKVLAVFLTLCLLLSLAAPAFAAGNQITIGTKEELLDLRPELYLRQLVPGQDRRSHRRH